MSIFEPLKPQPLFEEFVDAMPKGLRKEVMREGSAVRDVIIKAFTAGVAGGCELAGNRVPSLAESLDVPKSHYDDFEKDAADFVLKQLGKMVFKSTTEAFAEKMGMEGPMKEALDKLFARAERKAGRSVKQAGEYDPDNFDSREDLIEKIAGDIVEEVADMLDVSANRATYEALQMIKKGHICVAGREDVMPEIQGVLEKRLMKAAEAE